MSIEPGSYSGIFLARSDIQLTRLASQPTRTQRREIDEADLDYSDCCDGSVRRRWRRVRPRDEHDVHGLRRGGESRRLVLPDTCWRRWTEGDERQRGQGPHDAKRAGPGRTKSKETCRPDSDGYRIGVAGSDGDPAR